MKNETLSLRRQNPSQCKESLITNLQTSMYLSELISNVKGHICM